MALLITKQKKSFTCLNEQLNFIQLFDSTLFRVCSLLHTYILPFLLYERSYQQAHTISPANPAFPFLPLTTSRPCQCQPCHPPQHPTPGPANLPQSPPAPTLHTSATTTCPPGSTQPSPVSHNTQPSPGQQECSGLRPAWSGWRAACRGIRMALQRCCCIVLVVLGLLEGGVQMACKWREICVKAESSGAGPA